MLINFVFTPKKLLKVESEIKRVHLKVNESFSSEKVDTNRLRNLLDKIQTLHKEEIPRFSYELTKDELYLLADYMPKNNYDVDIGKIYEILKIRFRDEFLPIIFTSFQNYYYNVDFNIYFRNFLKLSKAPHKALKLSIEAVAIFMKWLEEEDLVDKIVKSYFSLNRDFNSYMKFFGFSMNKKLYEDCKKYLFTCCNKEFYLEADVKELLDIIMEYNQELMIKFVNNYLLKMELDEFQYRILDYIYMRYGKVDEERLGYIWDKIHPKAKEKYSIWLAQIQMNEFFQGDERYTFWFDYIKELSAKVLVVNDKQLFLDFGKFVVVEFREIGNAAYIYGKDVFDMYFSKYLNKSVIYNNGIFKNGDLMLTDNKIIHREGNRGVWQYRTNRLVNGLIAYYK